MKARQALSPDIKTLGQIAYEEFMDQLWPSGSEIEGMNIQDYSRLSNRAKETWEAVSLAVLEEWFEIEARRSLPCH